MDFQVRTGEERDLEGILDIYNYYVQNSPATFDTVRAEAKDRLPWLKEHSCGGAHRLFVAMNDGKQVLGWATTSLFRPRPAYATTVEASVYCKHDSVGLGIGTALYGALFKAIEKEDVERIVAGITLPNQSSVALHASFGFGHIGTFTRVGRKFGQYWDVAWFERPLIIDSESIAAARVEKSMQK